ncbi:hypothetical protein IQ270_07235 [Microcoleus sp. LEGE 07076]|uniref:hypothetical protein n=1 Tax=Microcoleus sp. LEGE 07076 TaxID=915322 RepID=UPI0018810197|nr:hypothetical protein [Microcoleus sp. LEGE 07076]MBE9184517.1 hypothetical protein [Microcoleus sp. LEGE 07076]
MENKKIAVEELHLGLVKTPPTEAEIVKYLMDAKSDLAKVKNIYDAICVNNATKAIEELTKQVEISREIRLDATELRIRSERVLGLLIESMPSKKKANRQLSNGSADRSGGFIIDSPEATFPTLKELGVRKDEANRCRKLSRVQEETFEAILTDVRLEVATRKRKTLSVTALVNAVRQLEKGKSESLFSPLIKPSDNWNFAQVKYGRIDEQDSETETWGYIPGELYANCFWYYVKPNDLVVAPMAGSGQVCRVYEARQEWMGKHVYDFDIKMFDLNPRGQYKDLITQHDLIKSFPVANPDYIVMDIPYYGMVAQQYSNKSEDLANMSLEDWQIAMARIAKNCATAQKTGTLCTVISPNYRDVANGLIVMVTDIIRSLWESAGYILHDKAYSSRRIQQNQSPHMARMNNKAKANRIMLTDITEILTFRRV